MKDFTRSFFAGVCTALAMASIAATGCSNEQTAPIAENRPVAYVDADGNNASQIRDSLRNPFPHMRFADGQVTWNDRCPVRKSPLNLRLAGLYVNGRPVGFC